MHISGNHRRPALLMCSLKSLRHFLLNSNYLFTASFPFLYTAPVNCIHVYFILFYCSRCCFYRRRQQHKALRCSRGTEKIFCITVLHTFRQQYLRRHTICSTSKDEMNSEYMQRGTSRALRTCKKRKKCWCVFDIWCGGCLFDFYNRLEEILTHCYFVFFILTRYPLKLVL